MLRWPGGGKVRGTDRRYHWLRARKRRGVHARRDRDGIALESILIAAHRRVRPATRIGRLARTRSRRSFAPPSSDDGRERGRLRLVVVAAVGEPRVRDPAPARARARFLEVSQGPGWQDRRRGGMLRVHGSPVLRSHVRVEDGRRPRSRVLRRGGGAGDQVLLPRAHRPSVPSRGR